MTLLACRSQVAASAPAGVIIGVAEAVTARHRPATPDCPLLDPLPRSRERRQQCRTPALSWPHRIRAGRGRKAFLARQNVKGGTALYDRDMIAHIAQVLKQSANSDHCARKLRVPSYCLESLAKAGLIDQVSDADASAVAGRPLYVRGSTDALIDKIRRCSVTLDGGVPLAEAMHGRGDSDDWTAVFAAIVSHEMPCALAPTGVGMGGH